MRLQIAVTLAICAACSDERRRPAKPASPYRAMARCGLGYQAPDGWTVTDPARLDTTAGAPRIEDLQAQPLTECRVAMTSLDGLVLEIAASPTWAEQPRIDITSGVPQATDFDGFVAANHHHNLEHVLTTRGEQLELPIGDEGDTILLSVATRGSGLIEEDPTLDVVAFGGLRLWGLHVLVAAAAGDVQAFARKDVEAVLASLTLE